MVLPPASNGDFPTFEIKLQAHALSKFTVDKREIGKLSTFFSISGGRENCGSFTPETAVFRSSLLKRNAP
jgi:hypothetical protein